MKKRVERAKLAKTKSAAKKVAGEPMTCKLKDLLFDTENPRLPEEVGAKSQDNLLKYIATEYHPLEVARSVATHGYFPSEPLILVASSAKGKKKGSFVVVEGNRRLAALKLLSEPDKADKLGLENADQWQAIGEKASLPEQFPCIVATSRNQVAPIIGYRHISGIEPWDPWAKARFLGSLIDEQKLSFDRVGSEVGEHVAAVRQNYRNYQVTKQATALKIDTSRVRAKFGVFTRAMQETSIQTFIHAVPSSEISRGKSAFKNKTKAKPRLQELISWIYGSANQGPVLTDSRKISDLSAVLGEADAIAELRLTRDLDAAFNLTGGVKDRLLSRLSKAATNLEAASQDIVDYAADEEVIAAVDRCEAALQVLKQ